MIHFVYPHEDRISCPDAIGRKVGDALREQYDVRQYDWNETGVITPRSGDILLGHPHPAPWTIFRRSLRRTGWRRRVAMFPYSHGDPTHIAYAESSVRLCDAVLAITGNYWFGRVDASMFAHWRPKLIHVDLAVDRVDYPRIKTHFNPPGRRKFIYIGNSSWLKNTGYLSAIANQLRSEPISWMGEGELIPGRIRHLGYHDFRESRAQAMVADHDFLISVSHTDANPATILEAIAWGLIPVCTAQSGYEHTAGIINIALDDAALAARQLARLQYLPESELHELRKRNDLALDAHFTWERFAEQVLRAVTSTEPRTRYRVSRRRRALIAYKALSSNLSPLRPFGLRLLAQRLGFGELGP